MNVSEEERQKTYSELVDEDDEWEEMREEFEDDREELNRIIEIMNTATLLGEMFSEDEITLGEYLDLTDYLSEEERKLDMSVP